MEDRIYDHLTLILDRPTRGPHEIGTVIGGSHSDHTNLVLYLPSPISLVLYEGDKVELTDARVSLEEGRDADNEPVEFSAIRSFTYAEIFIRDDRAEGKFRPIMMLEGRRISVLKQVDRYCRR